MEGDFKLRLQYVNGGGLETTSPVCESRGTWTYVSSLLMEGDLKLRLQYVNGGGLETTSPVC